MLAELGFAKREVVEAAVELARRSGELTGEVLIKSGVITPEQLSRALAERHGLDYIDFSVFKADMGAANLIDAGAAKRYAAVPVAFVDDRTLLVAMADPANILAVDDIAMMTRYDVQRAVARRRTSPPSSRTSIASSTTWDSRWRWRTTRRSRR